MTADRLRSYVGPTYLLACLTLGGSNQTIWLSAVLQMFGVAILCWALLDSDKLSYARETKQLALLAGATVALVLFQLVPLPPALWQGFPGRRIVSEGLSLLSLPPGWQPLSLDPFETLSVGLTLLPPLAMLSLMIVLRAFTRVGLALALLVGSVLGLCLGVFQVSGSDTTASHFYLQPEYDLGAASGFFANPNHMATLLLLTIPFLAAMVAAGKEHAAPGNRNAALILGAAGVVFVAVGLVLNGSLAGLGLVTPVLLLSGLLVFRLPAWVRVTAILASIVAVASFLAILVMPVGQKLIHGEKAVSISTRQDFFRTGLRVAGDYFPVGSGLGTFPRVYLIKEDPRTIDPTVFVNHAHDDYLEILIEAGLPGVLLVLLFFSWWGIVTARLLRAPQLDRFALAGAIGSAIILIHSFVDFPLRNSAIASCFAMCVALMAVPNIRAPRSNDLWPARHLNIR
jgi:O-antigen ligase